jgi:hypothetical protein
MKLRQGMRLGMGLGRTLWITLHYANNVNLSWWKIPWVIFFFKNCVWGSLSFYFVIQFHPYLRKVWTNRHGCATSIHAFNATIYHIHPIFLYVHPTDDKLQENSKSAWIKIYIVSLCKKRNEFLKKKNWFLHGPFWP